VKLFRTESGWILENDKGQFHIPPGESNALTTRDDLHAHLAAIAGRLPAADPSAIERLRPPLEQQEIWAAGVTYFRSRTARMEESKAVSGGHFYDLVYTADRPELFFKAAPWRVVGPEGTVRIRRDAKWNVPEPELALVVSPAGRIIGYTIGNDMSSRDIEGENPLYLPQAKVYDGACALGPAILVAAGPMPPSTRISLAITRQESVVFGGSTTLETMKRELQSLVEYLYRETSFPHGCVLLTGTGVVPPDEFTLQQGDAVAITIDGIGTLRNTVG
jgi:2-dehydro-3-deoxy-D-arabinonate dehydratase